MGEWSWGDKNAPKTEYQSEGEEKAPEAGGMRGNRRGVRATLRKWGPVVSSCEE